MAETRRYGLTPQLDIEQILLEAQHRWLRPAEICEILKNHNKFNIAPEPPNKPPSGALFLFDRKVLRYFRKDGHSWRKKKDGKTVKEAHERLKVGSIDVLHCYYAHGEENANFQRRSYWMLEEDFMHIVLVHYREVKNKESYNRSRDIEEVAQPGHCESPSASNSLESNNRRASVVTTVGSLNSAQTPEYEDAEPDFQASSRYNPLAELLELNANALTDADILVPQLPVQPQHTQGTYQGQRIVAPESDLFYVDQEDLTKYFDGTRTGFTFNGHSTQTDLTSWEEVMENYKDGYHGASFPPSLPSIDVEGIPNVLDEQDPAAAQGEAEWQFTDPEGGSLVTSNVDVRKTPVKEGKSKYYSLLKQLSLDFPNAEGDKGLQKHDSFSRWMSKELGEVGDSQMQSTSGIYWDAVEAESVVNGSTLSDQDHVDTYLLSPSLSQDQLFSIIDFSPGWAFSESGTKVVITGTFLKNRNDVDKCKWSCMLGEVEVPAEILADGILQCHAPPRKPGRVPFYITCSNRLACSEVREFEYRDKNAQCLLTLEPYSESLNEILYIRLVKFLSDGSLGHLETPPMDNEKSHICNKISSLLMGTEGGSEEEFFPDKAAKDHLQQTLLKEKLHTWLIHKVAEDGKGPNILDNEGQGVIHLAAALGYDWAIAPIIVAGVNINFRDAHGWTALHWAASCGRESTVVALISLGAASGLVTDPTPEFLSGRTPSDLASNNGHKGIAGFLAKTSLTSHLSMLTLKQSGESNISGISDINASEDAAERHALNYREGDPLKNSLDAVRTAVQAAARIHQVFRVQSFQRKEVSQYEDYKFGISQEHALSHLSSKGTKTGQHVAAVRIQNKFRGWKGRKEFLIIRQRIVKIQAHVRGHQVRKHIKKFVWSVGIVEKVILRWRRKGSGLRGFRSETSAEGAAMQVMPAVREDDYDFLLEGRKQAEARLDRALARVQSMVQYPDARDQYWRMLNAEKFQESKKVALERILNDPQEAIDADMMFEIEELLGDGTLMPTD